MKTLHSFPLYAVAVCLGVMLIYACSKDDDILCPSSIDTIEPSDTTVFPDHHIHDSVPQSFLEEIDRQEPVIITDPCDIIMPHGARGCDYVRYQGRTYVGHEAMLVARMQNKALEKSLKSNDPYAGLSSHDVWHALMSDMTILARYLTISSNFQFPYEGATSPGHSGIAYVYGAKQFNTRTNASAWGGCSDNLYGLDCSGFLQHVFFAGELDLPEGPAVHQGTVSTIQQALNTHQSTSSLTVQNLGALNTSEMIAGDIVYWNQLGGASASHIGFIGERTGGGLVVYQSNGSRSVDCPANYGPNRGARAFDLSNAYWFGGGADWHIVRITPGGMSWNPCTTLDAETVWDFNNGGTQGSTPLYTFHVDAEGGVPPYQYSFNMGPFQSDNYHTSHMHGPHICTVRDNQGCEITVAF